MEGRLSFRFERNIVWWEEGVPLVKGDWTAGRRSPTRLTAGLPEVPTIRVGPRQEPPRR